MGNEEKTRLPGIWRIDGVPLAVRIPSLPAIDDMRESVLASRDFREFIDESFGDGLDVVGNVAVIPVHGVLEQRADLFTLFFGGTSYEIIAAQVAAALNDGKVERIVLDFDTPGGSVHGVAELAELIYSARGQKPIVGIANNLCASAGYWIAAACSEVVLASETSLVGSIGIVAVHRDISKAEEKLGVKTTEIVAGKFKRVTSIHEPLTKDGRNALQEQADKLYSVFVDAVARYRGVSADAVLERMAEGREFIGQDAIDAGLAGRIESFSGLMARQKTGKSNNTEVFAMDEEKEKEEEQTAQEDEEEQKDEEQAAQEDEEKEKDEKKNAAAAIAKQIRLAAEKERARIVAILEVSGINIDDSTAAAISGGSSAEQYALAVLRSKSPRLSALSRESRTIPPAGPGQAPAGKKEEEAVISKACASVNERRR